MKIRHCSDLHCCWLKEVKDLEVILPKMADDKRSILVVAGDIDAGKRTEEVFRYLSKRFKYIIYCLGNHDYYGSTISKTIQIHEAMCLNLKNVFLLNKNYIKIGDWTFVGGTLWTDFRLFNTPSISAETAEYYMNDYRNIKYDGYKRLRAKDTLIEFNKTLSEIKNVKGENIIVVTHHAPSLKSVRIDFTTNSVTPAYASNLEEEIRALRPKYWIHGHLHTASDYQIGDTRVMSNPFGYYKYEENGMYLPKLIIDLDEELV